MTSIEQYEHYGSKNEPLPKKRTFLLNGVELPCPIKKPELFHARCCSITINNQEFHFDKVSDALKVKDALVDLMNEARDK